MEILSLLLGDLTDCAPFWLEDYCELFKAAEDESEARDWLEVFFLCTTLLPEDIVATLSEELEFFDSSLDRELFEDPESLLLTFTMILPW